MARTMARTKARGTGSPPTDLPLDSTSTSSGSGNFAIDNRNKAEYRYLPLRPLCPPEREIWEGRERASDSEVF
jgi:hypothetical protein